MVQLAPLSLSVPIRHSIRCSGRGELLPDGQCACPAGWGGDECALHTCKRDCSGHGVCSPRTGLCACDANYMGDDCFLHRPDPVDPVERLRCPRDCSARGRCDTATGKCSCAPGFSGAGCEVGACPNNCSAPYGRCVAGAAAVVGATARRLSDSDPEWILAAGPAGCECVAGRVGRDCSRRACPSGCSGHGACVDGACACERGYGGAACDTALCTPCLLYTSPSPRDKRQSRMPSSA